jgi:hypothetical protein
MIVKARESLYLRKNLSNTEEGLVQINSFKNHTGEGLIEISELVL